MQPATAQDLRYPVGKFQPPAVFTAAGREQFIQIVADLPMRMREAVRGLNEGQLDTAYRPDGWTLRQVVHHVPDSHMNAYIRFKLALTEENPTIKPYDEARCAELPDTQQTPVEVSLALLDNLHARWTLLLRAMTPAHYQRTYFHPEYQKSFTLDTALAMYEWHSRHHVAHITSLRERSGW